MTSNLPKLRTDLIVSRQRTANGTFFVVKDPVSGDFFRLREAEQFIAQQLDGKTAVAAVRQRTERKFGAWLSEEALNAFIKNLERTGLLENGKTTSGRRTGHRRRIRGSLLYLRFKILDPGPAFDRLIHRVRFCFTPYFVALSAALILLAVWITVANWSELAQDLSRLYRISVIPLAFALIFVIVSVHELAHGLTCKHFGGEVREMGFMFIYFQPAFYCNVSDAWLFPEKSKRLWVGFAGPYFELFLWSLATLVWRVTDVETGINYMALSVMTISGVKTLFNFNPLIKLDGYYLLSDYLELPNLRRKSFRYVGGLIERLLGLGPGSEAEISPRERRVYLVYGLSATVVSLFLLGYVLVKTGGFLIENQQPVALLLLTCLLGIRSRHRLRRLFGKSSDPSEPSDDGDGFEAWDGARTRDPAATPFRRPPTERIT